MTLLQNKDNLLPIGRSVKKIGVIGPNADNEPMLWGNYNGKPVHTTTILAGIRAKLGQDRVVYDKACDLVENKVTQSYFSRTSSEGKKGFTATYWNNRAWQGDAVIADQVDHPIKMTTAGDHEFASGVKLVGFSALYSTEFESEETEDMVF
jgi:beta-glucosidase